MRDIAAKLKYHWISCTGIECEVSIMKNSRRIQVSFTQKQLELIHRLKGEFGDNDANIVRNIVLAWLAEKSFISDSAKSKGDFSEHDEHNG